MKNKLVMIGYRPGRKSRMKKRTVLLNGSSLNHKNVGRSVTIKETLTEIKKEDW